MLNNLKNMIKQEEMSNALLESMTSAGDSDAVKDLFLDNLSVAVLGAENDPEIKTLAASIPEYDDHDEEVVAQIETLIESLTETEF